MQEIHFEVRRIISEVLAIGEDDVEVAQSLLELPGIESIKVLRIITKIEARFDVELDEQIVFNVKTLGELCAQVAELRAAKLSVGAA